MQMKDDAKSESGDVYLYNSSSIILYSIQLLLHKASCVVFIVIESLLSALSRGRTTSVLFSQIPISAYLR